MSAVEVVLQVVISALIFSFLYRLAKGEESIRDEGGRLRPLAALVAIFGGMVVLTLVGVVISRLA